MPIPLSQRACNTPASPIRRLSHHAKDATERGTRVYHLNIGQPDIRTPVEFAEGIRAYSDEVVAYGPSEGDQGLRNVWTEKINAQLGTSLNPEQMLITTGASEGLIFTFMTICDPEDEIIIFDPTYANYMGFAAISGIKLVSILSDIENNFALPEKDLIENKITEKTHGILLCNPNNPTGTVYSREEVELLIDICNRHNLFLIVDETYREFVFDNLDPVSVLNIAEKNDRVIVIDSLSKRFSLCGARIGCMITSNQKILAKTLNLAQARLAVTTFAQTAAAHMLDKIPENFIDNVISEFESRRNLLYEEFKRIPGVTIHKPQGAFYTVVRLPVENAEDFATFMLKDFNSNGETTFVAPASGFYMTTEMGLNEIRIAYVLNEKELKRAIEILGEGLLAYQAR